MFVGEPFHTLPLAGDVDWASFALFVNVSDNAAWVNNSSPKWEQNHMVSEPVEESLNCDLDWWLGH